MQEVKNKLVILHNIFVPGKEIINKVVNELYKGIPLLDMIVEVKCNSLIDDSCNVRK